MKNVKYEGGYPCMHNHSTRIGLLTQGEKLNAFSFIFKWMKKWEEEAEITNLFIRQQ
jgi:hypothetical protein